MPAGCKLTDASKNDAVTQNNVSFVVGVKFWPILK